MSIEVCPLNCQQTEKCLGSKQCGPAIFEQNCRAPKLGFDYGELKNGP